MNSQNFFNSFGKQAKSDQGGQGLLANFGNLAQSIPGGLAGGAAAGGLMALLVNNKKARKFAGKAATVGGAAVVGGLAFKAFQSWQQNQQGRHPQPASLPAETALHNEASFIEAESTAPGFEWTLIKAMVSIARIDGNLDSAEQQRIFKTIEEMDLPLDAKGQVFELLGRDISIDELVQGVDSLELKSELYLASCLAVELDHPAEFAYLNQLATKMGIPEDFATQLRQQAAEIN
jgi:uncharacterized membrane protein YebE (DUF533 family)